MMTDFSWLATEAKHIHALFEGMFFSVITTMLLLGVILEYFKFSVGGLPTFSILVGRSIIAALLLAAFPEILNFISTVVDGLANDIGSLNKFNLVLSRMGDHLDHFSWSWSSAKSMVLVVISFLSFFSLYVSVYLTDAMYVFTWTLLYIFSPILIACYVIPSLSGITKNLFKSLIVVASWKVMWSVLAAIVWSSALINIDRLPNEADLLTICLFNLMLAASLLFAPFVANSFISQGLENASTRAGAAAVAAASMGAKYVLKYGKDKLMPNKKDKPRDIQKFNQNKPRNFNTRRNQ